LGDTISGLGYGLESYETDIEDWASRPKRSSSRWVRLRI